MTKPFSPGELADAVTRVSGMSPEELHARRMEHAVAVCRSPAGLSRTRLESSRPVMGRLPLVLPHVPVPPKHLDDYREAAGDEAVERFLEVARPLKGLRLLHLNSTAFGGGVAELLFTHIGLLQDVGIDAQWHLIEGSEDFFAITKAAHNGLQGAEVPWTRDMEKTYLARIRDNARQLSTDWDVYFIHDPQPSALRTLLAQEDR